MTKTAVKTAISKAAKPSTKTKSKNPATKQAKIIALLQRQKGATIAELSKLSGWQEHSIRGFISGTLKKRMGLNVVSEKNNKGTRYYRISNSTSDTSGNTTPQPGTKDQV